MAISTPTYELAVGTTEITTKQGTLTLATIKAAAADCSISCYDCAAAGDIASSNKLVSFEVEILLNGKQGGGNIEHPLRFKSGLVIVVAGTGAVGYGGYTR